MGRDSKTYSGTKLKELKIISKKYCSDIEDDYNDFAKKEEIEILSTEFHQEVVDKTKKL